MPSLKGPLQRFHHMGRPGLCQERFRWATNLYTLGICRCGTTIRAWGIIQTDVLRLNLSFNFRLKSELHSGNLPSRQVDAAARTVQENDQVDTGARDKTLTLSVLVSRKHALARWPLIDGTRKAACQRQVSRYEWLLMADGRNCVQRSYVSETINTRRRPARAIPRDAASPLRS